jgi:hypothetical protein
VKADGTGLTVIIPNAVAPSSRNRQAARTVDCCRPEAG